MFTLKSRSIDTADSSGHISTQAFITRCKLNCAVKKKALVSFSLKLTDMAKYLQLLPMNATQC